MKWDKTPAFDADLKRLSRAELGLFRRVVHEEFLPAAQQHVANRASAWPKKLRVKGVANAPGLWEMTWSFAGPDGRATFEWVSIGGEPAICWRRVGGHAIFDDPGH